MIESTNLYDALKAEIDRVLNLKTFYEELDIRPFQRAFMNKALKQARSAMASQDDSAMQLACRKLQKYKL